MRITLDTNSTNKRDTSAAIVVFGNTFNCAHMSIQKKRKRGNERKKTVWRIERTFFYSRPPSQKNTLKHITSKRASDTWK